MCVPRDQYKTCAVCSSSRSSINGTVNSMFVAWNEKEPDEAVWANLIALGKTDPLNARLHLCTFKNKAELISD